MTTPACPQCGADDATSRGHSNGFDTYECYCGLVFNVLQEPKEVVTIVPLIRADAVAPVTTNGFTIGRAYEATVQAKRWCESGSREITTLYVVNDNGHARIVVVGYGSRCSAHIMGADGRSAGYFALITSWSI